MPGGWTGEDPDLAFYGTKLMGDDDLAYYGTTDVSYDWSISHREWNRLMHALHGNGTAPAKRQRKTEVLRFGTINVNGVHAEHTAGTVADEHMAEEMRGGRDVRMDSTEKLDELINMFRDGGWPGTPGKGRTTGR